MAFFDTPQSAQNDELELTQESMALITEAIILEGTTEEELAAFLENASEVNASYHDEVLMEKSVVRLDRAAKLSRAHKVAIFTVAKERNDPMFAKLVTVWRMERFLEDSLMRKYGNEGMRRARAAMNKTATSASSTIRKATNKTTRKVSSPNSMKQTRPMRMPMVNVPTNYR